MTVVSAMLFHSSSCAQDAKEEFRLAGDQGLSCHL